MNNKKNCIKCGSPFIGQYNIIADGSWQPAKVCVCSIWREHTSKKDDPRSVRIDGNLYWVGKANGVKHRGMGGRVFWIEMADGQIIKTNNLWHLGEIPGDWQNDLWDNARFMTERNLDEYMHDLGLSALI